MSLFAHGLQESWAQSEVDVVVIAPCVNPEVGKWLPDLDDEGCEPSRPVAEARISGNASVPVGLEMCQAMG